MPEMPTTLFFLRNSSRESLFLQLLEIGEDSLITNPEQKELLTRFDDSINSSNTEHRPNKKTWTESVGDFFKRMSE